MAGIKQLRSWFFGVSSDATRLRNSDKPNQQLFENLLESVAMPTMSTDRAKVSTGATVASEQGLSVLASDVQAKANASQLTDRSLVVQPHQLPTAEAIVNTVVEDMPATPLAVTTAVNTTRNQYTFRLSPTWITWLISRLIPQGGTTGQVLVKQSGTNYDTDWEQLADNSTFTTALLANNTFINALTTQIITNNPTAIIDGLATGVLIPWTASSVPSSKFIFPIGQAISRTTYAEYFAKVGTTYGVGDGSTTFNVIDIRDKQLEGVSGSKVLGSTGGAETHTISTANLPTHIHSLSGATTAADGAHTHTWTNGEPSPYDNIAILQGGGALTNVILSTGSNTDIASSGAHIHSLSGNTGDGGFANTALPTLDPYVAVNMILKVLP